MSRGNNIRKTEVEQIIDFYKKGYSQTFISRKINRSLTTVENAIRLLRVIENGDKAELKKARKKCGNNLTDLVVSCVDVSEDLEVLGYEEYLCEVKDKRLKVMECINKSTKALSELLKAMDDLSNTLRGDE